MVARRYPPDIRSGTETVFENLYQRARRHHDVRLVVGYRRDRSLVPPEAVAVDLRHGSLPRRYARLWARTATEILRWRPQVVLSNSIEVPVFQVPTACIVHDLNFGRAQSGESSPVQDAGRLGRRLFYRIRSRRLAAIVTVSEAMRQNLGRAGLPLNRIAAIRNGVDLQAFRPPEGPPPERERLVVAYPSRILEGKGQHLAIDAIGRLKPAERDQVELQIVGTVADPLYLDRLEVLAWNQPVTFHLEVPDIVPYYQGADIVVFPTRMSEGFGFTAVEAMACGKPVIWADQPAIREATGGIGIPVADEDPDRWADALRRLMGDPQARREMGRAGRALVQDRYDWGRVWARYETVLRAIAKGAPVPARPGTEGGLPS